MLEKVEELETVFLNALLNGERTKCSQLVLEYLDNGASIIDLYENLLKATLYRVGELWESNEIGVATEHLASAIVEGILTEVYWKYISTEEKGNRVIASCIENETHQVGIKMVGDVFETNGWTSYFLGANTPNQELVSLVKIIKPAVLAISLSMYFHLSLLEEMIGKVREFSNIPILIGGLAFRVGDLEFLKNYPNLVYLNDLYSLDEYIKNHF